jgi:heme ABC exporter ATP-binding subunit CcmA
LGSDALVVARGLTRRFGAATALDRIDLDVRRGEALALFGGNGAGKSTLLRILARLLKPTAGSLAVAEPRARVGYLSHQTLLYDDLTVSQNLLFFARLHGLHDPAGRALDSLAGVGLGDRSDVAVRTLSRGQQQRAALARALLHEPTLLLLDEPSSGLDGASVAALETGLRQAAARGATLILATHDVGLALSLCPRWVALAAGRTVDGGGSGGPDAERARALARGFA